MASNPLLLQASRHVRSSSFDSLEFLREFEQSASDDLAALARLVCAAAQARCLFNSHLRTEISGALNRMNERDGVRSPDYGNPTPSPTPQNSTPEPELKMPEPIHFFFPQGHSRHGRSE